MKLHRRTLKLGDVEVGETPMLVPSFSSVANVDLRKTIEAFKDIIPGPILVSAYDVYHSRKSKAPLPSLGFAQLVFLDSGGYEKSKDTDISKLGFYEARTKKWTREMHRKILREWPRDPPSVAVSYDAPSVRMPLDKQIAKANELFEGADGMLKEIILKPERRKPNTVDAASIKRNIGAMSDFDSVGFTEKELGNSVLDRMTTIAQVRAEMDQHGMDLPIHVFGSLDPVTTPLYFIAGADIFDGLTWLRFIMHRETSALYMDCCGARINGIDLNHHQLWYTTVSSNLICVTKLERSLRRFMSSNSNYSYLGPHNDFFRKASEDLVERMGGVI